MRRFETVQLVTVAVAVYLPVLLGYRPKRGRIAVVVLAAMALQLVVEGFRWQLIPLHVASVGLAVGDLLREERRVRGLPRFRRAVLGVAGVALVAFLPVVLPVPRLPPPGGPFAVGTATFVVVDADREEPYGKTEEDDPGETGSSGESGVEDEEQEEVGEPRRLVVQAWYPADVPEGSEPAGWTSDFDVLGPEMSRRLGFPGFFLDHTSEVRSHSHPRARPLSGRFPVVLYSHGWAGFRGVALDQMEELASHGYLVLAPDHTHAALATRFPDGDVVALDARALPDLEEVGERDYQRATALLVETVGGDLTAILDALGEGADGPFGDLASQADLELVGMYGHSVGGGAAVWACLQDDRCDAVAGLDPWVEPIPNPVLAEELQMPSLFIRSDEWRASPNDRRLRGLAERSPALNYWVGVEGASHSDFVMLPYLTPYARWAGLKGPIPARTIASILDVYLVGFFDRHLLGIGGAVLNEQTPPEVMIEIVP